MLLEKGDRFLVLRYSSGSHDCIEDHKAVLDQYGYCWFGKIGVAPSGRAIEEKLGKKRLVVLYCQGKTYICNMLDYSFDKPAEGYPPYYEDFLYKRNIIPKIYFKLGSIDPLPSEVFAKCVSLSSRRPLAETTARSMASFFYGELPTSDALTLPANTRRKKKRKTQKIKIEERKVDKYSCSYEQNGTCTNSRSVNYGYECERPNYCVNQKPRPIEN